MRTKMGAVNGAKTGPKMEPKLGGEVVTKGGAKIYLKYVPK